MKRLILFLLLVACKHPQQLNLVPTSIDLSKSDKVQSASSQVMECHNLEWEVHFSPKGGAAAQIVEAINEAKSSIYIQAYSFTSKPITDALILQKRKGIIVEAILDKSNIGGNGSKLKELIAAGIPTYIDSAHAIAHNKIMIIDKKVVLTGSFNFTNAAEERNAENSIKLIDSNLARVYQENWELHKLHSQLQKK